MFGFWEAQPQFRREIELPQRTAIGRFGGSRRFWIGISLVTVPEVVTEQGPNARFPRCANRK